MFGTVDIAILQVKALGMGFNLSNHISLMPGIGEETAGHQRVIEQIRALDEIELAFIVGRGCDEIYVRAHPFDGRHVMLEPYLRSLGLYEEPIEFDLENREKLVGQLQAFADKIGQTVHATNVPGFGLDLSEELGTFSPTPQD